MWKIFLQWFLISMHCVFLTVTCRFYSFVRSFAVITLPFLSCFAFVRFYGTWWHLYISLTYKIVVSWPFVPSNIATLCCCVLLWFFALRANAYSPSSCPRIFATIKHIPFIVIIGRVRNYHFNEHQNHVASRA